MGAQVAQQSKQDKIGLKCEYQYNGVTDKGTELSLSVIQVSANKNIYAVLLKAKHPIPIGYGRISGLGKVSDNVLVFTNEDFKVNAACRVELHFSPDCDEVRIVTVGKKCKDFHGDSCPGFEGILTRQGTLGRKMLLES
jgi:hypothetical protein